MSGLVVYLAGPYAARDTLAAYAHELMDVGYRVRCRWLDGTHELGPEGPAVEAARADRIRWAREDLQDVGGADILVSFTAAAVLPVTEQHRGKSGGRHIETGYALALGKKVILVGEPENVFHWLPEVERHTDWHAALIALAGRLVAHGQRQAVVA